MPPEVVALAEAPTPVARPSISAPLTTASLPSARPDFDPQPGDAPAEPEAQMAAQAAQAMSTGAIEAAMALAPTRSIDDGLPFAETFSDAGSPRRSGVTISGIDLEAIAMRPFTVAQPSDHAPSLARLHHPRPADLSDVPTQHADTLDARFSKRMPKLSRSQFSGAAVVAMADEPAPESGDSQTVAASAAGSLAGFFARLFR